MRIMEKAKERFLNIINENNLSGEQLIIKMKPLKPEQVIGYPQRDDYPLLLGKEVMIEADFKGHKGQAFTDEPFDFEGRISDIINLSLDTNRNRALFISSLNAILRFLNIITGTVHCKDLEPEMCAKKLVEKISEDFGANIKITLAGLQPSFADALIKKYGSKNVSILDLDVKNFNKNFNGVIVKDSSTYSSKLLPEANVVIATGSTIINNTIDEIISLSQNNVVFFGVTIAGVAELLKLKRICFFAH